MLAEKAAEIRKLAVEAIYHAKSGHPGGSLSIADIMSYLYFKEMKVDAADPKNPERDRFVLSKGHCCPALYAALAMKGFFPKEDLKTTFPLAHQRMNNGRRHLPIRQKSQLGLRILQKR